MLAHLLRIAPTQFLLRSELTAPVRDRNFRGVLVDTIR